MPTSCPPIFLIVLSPAAKTAHQATVEVLGHDTLLLSPCSYNAHWLVLFLAKGPSLRNFITAVPQRRNWALRISIAFFQQQTDL